MLLMPGPPVVPFLPFFWGRVPLLNRLQEKGYPYSNLSNLEDLACLLHNISAAGI